MTDYLKVAKECGATYPTINGVEFEVAQLEAFASRILADNEVGDEGAVDTEFYNRILADKEALIAMQGERLEKIAFMGMDAPMQCDKEYFYQSQLRNCISIASNNSASAESVAAWEEAKLKPLQEAARFWQDKCGGISEENVLLKQQVAMLHKSIRVVDDNSEEVEGADGFMAFEVSQYAIHQMREAADDTQATAETLQCRELEAKIEGLRECYVRNAGHGILAYMEELRKQLAELRAGKKEGAE